MIYHEIEMLERLSSDILLSKICRLKFQYIFRSGGMRTGQVGTTEVGEEPEKAGWGPGRLAGELEDS